MGFSKFLKKFLRPLIGGFKKRKSKIWRHLWTLLEGYLILFRSKFFIGVKIWVVFMTKIKFSKKFFLHLGLKRPSKLRFFKSGTIFKMAYLLKATPDFFEFFRKVSQVGLLYLPKRSSWAIIPFLRYFDPKIA